MKATQCVKKGCLAYISYVVTAKKEKKQSPDLSIMKKYYDALWGDQPAILRDRQVKFKVDTTWSANGGSITY